MKVRCIYCGEQLTKEEIVHCMLVSLCGGKIYPDPMYCPDTEDHVHVFEEIKVEDK